MKYLVLAAMLLTLMGCSDSDSDQRAADKERQARQEQELERLAKEQAASRAQASEPAVAEQAPEGPAEPETPPEPEKVAQYKLLEYGRGLTPRVNCMCREKSECGMTFYACDDNAVYSCIHEVKYTVGETIATEKNTGQCE